MCTVFIISTLSKCIFFLFMDYKILLLNTFALWRPCFSMLLLFDAFTPWCPCSSVPSLFCTFAPLHLCFLVSLLLDAFALLCLCSLALLLFHALVFLCFCFFAPLLLYALASLCTCFFMLNIMTVSTTLQLVCKLSKKFQCMKLTRLILSIIFFLTIANYLLII